MNKDGHDYFQEIFESYGYMETKNFLSTKAVYKFFDPKVCLGRSWKKLFLHEVPSFLSPSLSLCSKKTLFLGNKRRFTLVVMLSRPTFFLCHALSLYPSVMLSPYPSFLCHALSSHPFPSVTLFPYPYFLCHALSSHSV